MSPDFINLLGILERAGVVQTVTNTFITPPAAPAPVPVVQIVIADANTAGGSIAFDFGMDGTLTAVQSVDNPQL